MKEVILLMDNMTAKTARIDNDKFLQLIDSKSKSNSWIVNTIYENLTGKAVSDPAKIKSQYTYLDIPTIQELTLHRGIGNKFIGVDPRLIGQKMILHRTKLVKYDQGGFMKRHADNKSSKELAGRLVFIPPAKLKGCKYECGGLTLYYKYQNHHVNQDEEKWTIVFLPYSVPHEVNTVASGTRYSIVCDVSIKGVDTFDLDLNDNYSDESEDDVGLGFDYFY